jgi:hypothetical protein
VRSYRIIPVLNTLDFIKISSISTIQNRQGTTSVHRRVTAVISFGWYTVSIPLRDFDLLDQCDEIPSLKRFG